MYIDILLENKSQQELINYSSLIDTILSQSMKQSNSSNVKQMKTVLNDVMDKIIKSKVSESNSANLNLFYDTFSVQVYNTSERGTNENEQTALTNSLSIINFTNCEVVLKQIYNIPTNESLLIYKIDYSKYLNGNNNNNNNNSNIAYKVFDDNGSDLNMSYCNNTKVNIKISATQIQNGNAINTTLYSEYFNNSDNNDNSDSSNNNHQRIDVYNSNSSFYNDICYSYSKHGNDLALNDRRNTIYPNISIECSDSCSYNGIDNNNYIDCKCSVVAEVEVSANIVEDFLSTLTKSNFMIFTCYNKILSIVKYTH